MAQAALLLPLLAVDGVGELWIVYAVVGAEAVLATLNEPVRQALLPAVVADAELTAAAGQLGLGANVARLVGGALGGVLLEAYGLGGVVLGDAVTFLVAAAVLAGPALGSQAPRATGPAERPDRAWLAGLAVIRDRPELRGTLAVGALMALAQGAFVVLFVVFVLRSLHGGGAEVGLLRGVQAVGGILGGLAAGRLARRLGPAALVGAALGGFALVEAAIWNGPAVTTALPLYVVLFAVVGAPGVVVMSGLTSVLLTATPEAFRGRVVEHPRRCLRRPAGGRDAARRGAGRAGRAAAAAQRAGRGAGRRRGGGGGAAAVTRAAGRAGGRAASSAGPPGRGRRRARTRGCRR